MYVARDIQSGTDYALKRLFGCDKDECNNIIKEINLHKQVSGHPNIVQFITASFIDRTQNSGRAEYLLVTELCKGGSLYDCLEQPMEPQTVLKIMYQATKAVAHMHSHNINHRDIKVENFLLGTDGLLKLCDFGSATIEHHAPDITWSTQQRNNLEELLQKFTTPMYRAPEQLDTWNNYPIGVKTDVWALGCILFCLCYKKHPFEDGAKLRIINGNYSIPSDSRFACFNDIIKGCFVVDPNQRFDVSMVLERLGAISESKDWSLKGPIEVVGKPLDSPPVEVQNPPPAQPSPVPSRPPPPRPTSNPQQQRPEIRQVPPVQNPPQSAQQPASGGLFSSFKGGAGSFLKNLKDTSSKVMQSVQQTMARNDLDISYITQRIIVMPCPTEGLESAYKTNHIDDVKVYMDQRFPPAKISVYNLGPRCARLAPPVRTVECGFIYQPNPPKAPSLVHMYSLAEDMYSFLHSDPKAVIIIQSPDGGKSTASTMIGALMIFAQLIREPEDALQMFAVKRMPPNHRPSELRYLYYAADIVRSHWPHYQPITLVSTNFSPVPRMTKARDGCRLYIEVVANDRVVISTLQDYDRMRLYHASEGKINLPLNITVCGDITITLYHARNAIAGMGRPQGLKICQLQFHSGFIPEEETLLSFNRSELDEVPDEEHVPGNFNLSLSVFVGDDERAPATQPPWITSKNSQRDPTTLFASQLEYEENVDNFISKPSSNSSPTKHIPPPRPAPPVVHHHEPLICQSDYKDDPDTPTLVSVEKTTKSEAPTAEFDFLNLGGEKPPPAEVKAEPPKIAKVKEPSFDLLGGFDSNFSDPFPDLVGSAMNKPTVPVQTNSSGLDDIFGSLPQTTAPTIVPSKSSNDLNGLNLNFDAGSSAKQPQDPFAELTKSLHPEWSSGPAKPTPSPMGTQYSTPIHQFGAAPAPSSASGTPKNNPSTPIHQMKSPSEPQRPDYSRSHFQESQPAGSAPKSKSTDIFGDILGSQGYSFGTKTEGPKTINAMRKVEQAQTMDPERLKVMEWVSLFKFI